MDELINDVLHQVIVQLALRDVTSLALTCKSMHAATKDRLGHVKRVLSGKQQQWETGPPIIHLIEIDRRIIIDTAEWARPSFGREQALQCFAIREVYAGMKTNIQHIHIFSNGQDTDVDTTILKLTKWMPEYCRNILCLYITGNVQSSHLVHFYNAKLLLIHKNDYIDDATLLNFVNMESLSIELEDCHKASGACVERLITDHALRYVEWHFDQSSIPLNMLSPTLRRLQLIGAFRMGMTYCFALGDYRRCIKCWNDPKCDDYFTLPPVPCGRNTHSFSPPAC